MLSRWSRRRVERSRLQRRRNAGWGSRHGRCTRTGRDAIAAAARSAGARRGGCWWRWHHWPGRPRVPPASATAASTRGAVSSPRNITPRPGRRDGRIHFALSSCRSRRREGPRLLHWRHNRCADVSCCAGTCWNRSPQSGGPARGRTGRRRRSLWLRHRLRSLPHRHTSCWSWGRRGAHRGFLLDRNRRGSWAIAAGRGSAAASGGHV